MDLGIKKVIHSVLDDLVDTSVLRFGRMILLESGGFTKLPFYCTDNFNEEVFHICFVVESFTFLKEGRFATEEASTLISLIELMHKDIFEFNGRIVQISIARSSEFLYFLNEGSESVTVGAWTGASVSRIRVVARRSSWSHRVDERTVVTCKIGFEGKWQRVRFEITFLARVVLVIAL
jgi:hypothetical protein